MNKRPAPLIAGVFLLVSSPLWAGAGIVSTDFSTSVVRGQSVVSSVNSSTTPLAANATFYGTFEDTLGYSGISILVGADAATITDGFHIEWSADGVEDVDHDFFSLSSGTAKQFTFGVPARYFRIHFVNGSTAQTEFTMQTIFHTFNSKPSSHRLIDNLNDQDDAELVKAIVAAKDDDDGTYTNLTTKDGRLKVEARTNQATNLYGTSADGVAAALAGTDNPILLLVNPATSTYTAKIFVRFYGVDVNNVSCDFHLFLDPTITLNGINNDIVGIGQAVSTNTVVTAYRLPTISALGSVVDIVQIGQNNAPALVSDNFSIWLKPGHKLLFTADPSSNGRAVYISTKWQEE